MKQEKKRKTKQTDKKKEQKRKTQEKENIKIIIIFHNIQVVGMFFGEKMAIDAKERGEIEARTVVGSDGKPIGKVRPDGMVVGPDGKLVGKFYPDGTLRNPEPAAAPAASSTTTSSSLADAPPLARYLESPRATGAARAGARRAASR